MGHILKTVSNIYIFNISKIMITDGLSVTLGLFVITLLLSIPLGLLISLGRISRIKIISRLTEFYTWILRGTPLLLQLIFIYYGLATIKINGSYISLDRFTAAVIAFVLNYAAYFAEIFRAGIQSIDKGQYEAADVLGLTYKQTMVRIIIPQMFKRVLPPVSNEVITLVKDTALVYAIGMQDILRIAQNAATRDFLLLPFAVAGVFYLAMTFIFTRVFNFIEKKYSYYN